MRSLSLLAAAAVFVGLPATAQTADSGAAPKPKKERKLCRAEQNSGSNLVRSVCRTRAEWQQIDGRGETIGSTDGGAAGLNSGVTK